MSQGRPGGRRRAASRHAADDSDGSGDALDQVDHLERSLAALSSQHAAVNARLLSTLDSLDVLQSTNADALECLHAEREALEARNIVLANELASARGEAASARAALQSGLTVEPLAEMTLNGPLTRESMAGEHADLSIPGYTDLDSSSSDPSPRQAKRKRSRYYQARSLIVGLSQQLEYTRSQADEQSREAAAEVAVLKSQLHSRDEELQTLFHWLDSVLGLRGYEAAGEVREQSLRAQSDASEPEMASLKAQVEQLHEETSRQVDRLNDLVDASPSSIPDGAESLWPAPNPAPFVDGVIGDVQLQIADLETTLAGLRQEEAHLLRLQGHDAPRTNAPASETTYRIDFRRTSELQAELARAEAQHADERSNLESFFDRVLRHLEAKQSELEAAEVQVKVERRCRVAAEQMLRESHGAMERMLHRVA